MDGLVKFLVGAGICVALAAGGFAALPGIIGDAAHDLKDQALNATADLSDAKSLMEDLLNDNIGTLAAAAGMTEAEVRAAIEGLDLASWGVTELPEGAIAYDTFPITYEGLTASVTIYEDPGYVTVEAFGQSLTLSVPESAQEYVGLLQYAQFIQ